MANKMLLFLGLLLLFLTSYLGLKLVNGDGIGFVDGGNRYWIYGHDNGCDSQFKYADVCGEGTNYQENCCCSYRDKFGTGGVCIPQSGGKNGK